MGSKSRTKRVTRSFAKELKKGINYEQLAEFAIGTLINRRFKAKYRFAVPDPDAPILKEASGEHVDFLLKEVMDKREELYVKKDGYDKVIRYVEFMASVSATVEVRALYYLYKIVKESWLQRKRRLAVEKIYSYASRLRSREVKELKSYEKIQE